MSSPSGSETSVRRETRASQNLSVAELIRVPWVMELLLAAGTFLMFAGTLAFGFIYDDRMQILGNASITRWSYVPQYFTKNVWALIDPTILANYYRPLFLLWLRINYALFGLNPTGWHALSIALQIIVVVQVYWLGRRLLRSDGAAAFAAALFAVHPVHIESVAWISGSTDPMLAVFMLASTLAFLRYLDEIGSGQGGKWAHAASLVFFGFALLSKEVAVMLPLMLLPTAVYTRKQHTSVRDVELAAVPYFLLITAYLLVRQYALSGFSHPLTRLSTKNMVLTWPSVMALYARQLIAPFWISPYLNVRWATAITREFWVSLAICVALLCIAWIAWKRSSDRKLLNALYAWTLLPLLPVLYIKVFSESEVAHDRYLYLSSVGFCILVVALVQALTKRLTLPPGMLKSIGAALLVLLATVTISGELYWASDLLLFKHALEVAPENGAAALNLGISYAEHKRPDLAEPLLKGIYTRSPKSALAAYNYGELLARTGQWALAEPVMRHALDLDPRNAGWWMEFSNVEITLGRVAEAQAAAKEAVHLRPDAPGYHAVLGVLAMKAGDRNTATQEFNEELKRNPESPAARSGLQELESHNK
jgi:tetratricopeptide (TPR) repeat protein